MRASILGVLIFVGGALSSTAIAGDESYRIGPKDVLSVEVYGEEEPSRDYKVSAAGLLSMPFLEPVQVQGLTPEEAASLLTGMSLDGFYNNPQISVRVSEHLSQQVKVLGAVKKPGVYHLEGPSSLLEILGEAGWIDVQKSSDQVRIVRTTGEIITVGLQELVNGGAASVTVLPGDLVSVVAGAVVYVGGEVEKAGSVMFFEGLTVMQALLKVGGPNETAKLRGAYVMRDGEKIPVNLKRISDGRESDYEMRPGDQLFLKESPI
ncbi:MAG: hypothetical protein GWP91_00775 [Rhodobacterales bacterium]|nr:hypothetical protein [Rhodobacterales bacterium]